MTRAVKWFAYVTSIGVLVNIAGMALPFLLAPQWAIDRLGLPGGGGSVVWLRQAGLLLLFLSLLYLPGAFDPKRYTANAVFAVVARLALGLYWLFLVAVEGQARAFLLLGAFDCGYAVLNALFLRPVLVGPSPDANRRAGSART